MKFLDNDDKEKLANEIITGTFATSKVLNFIHDYRSYNTRQKYKITDMEYFNRITQVILNMQHAETMFRIASALLEKNNMHKGILQDFQDIKEIVEQKAQEAQKKQQKKGNKNDKDIAGKGEKSVPKA